MIAGGLNSVVFDAAAAEAEMDQHWEILAEAMQTILRKEGFLESYEKIKSLTMGRSLNKIEFLSIINEMQGVPDDIKDNLRRLSPRKYLGWAQTLQDK